MPAANAAELLNLVGFITGAVLYAMLLALVVRTPRRAHSTAPRDPLPLATAVLGLAWNVGELFAYLLPRLGMARATIGLTAFSFPAIGLLAAVVVHSVARTLPGAKLVTVAAYSCALAASALHIHTIVTGSLSSSAAAFTLLTVGFGLVMLPLAILTRRQSNGPRALWMLALALFAISATHLGRVHGPDSPWLVELAGHHAAIPLAFAILYQDYRFALADLFLKQALTLLVLVVLVFTGYSAVVTWVGSDALSVGLLLMLWIGTTLLYPALRRQIVRFVDRVLLGRVDYHAQRLAIAQALGRVETIDAILEAVCFRLADALNAQRAVARTADRRPSVTAVLEVAVPTAEEPSYVIDIGELAGGRRLLSDDEAFADAIGAIAGRRIDAVRLTNERYERRLREEEMQKLTAEAELRALRAQINPHFLFNALTTIGYLIDSSPKRAVRTLMRLTALLRAVLRSEGELTTIGRELELVEHYLDIERERFEERLRVTIDVPAAHRRIQAPALIIQPLVENAIKHGISPSASGGAVEIRTSLEGDELRLVIRNTGAPLAVPHLGGGANGRRIGLDNVAQRLLGHFGLAASLTLHKDVDEATIAELRLPARHDVREKRAS